MTSIRTALALGALAGAAALAGPHAAWAQVGRRVAAPVVVAPAPVAPAPIVTLLTTVITAPAPIAPATSPVVIAPAAAGPVGSRGPNSQMIPGPVINN